VKRDEKRWELISRVSPSILVAEERRARQYLFFLEEMIVKKDTTTTRREFVERVGEEVLTLSSQKVGFVF
jgi:hypothetical protein